MAKKVIQDVVKKPKERKEKKTEPEPVPLRSVSFKKVVLFLAIMALIALEGFFLIDFSSATIKITPHQEFINLNEELKMGFEVIQVEKEDSQTSPSTEMAIFGQKAGGQIVVYNTYSSSQRLITQTRFETPEGKIYKIQDPITIPAGGSKEVTVYAEKPGPEYNIGLTDFTVPGLKGTARYQNVYARSKTAMKGGTKENTLVISEKDISQAKNALKEKIENYLKEKIVQQKPEGYLLYKNNIKIDFSEDPSNPKAGDSLDKFFLKMKGVARGYLIKESDLSKTLVDKYFSEKNTKIVNPEKLEFNLLSRNEKEAEISFNLKGEGHFAWSIDTNLLASSLRSAPDRRYKEVFKNFPEIERAEIIFKPVWWPWLPKNQSRLLFEIVLNK